MAEPKEIDYFVELNRQFYLRKKREEEQGIMKLNGMKSLIIPCTIETLRDRLEKIL